MRQKIILMIFSFTLNFSFAQNVGIGTANPISKLTVNGNLSLGSSYTSLSAPTNGAIIEGPVGIGTTTPLAMLSVDNVPNNLWGFHVKTTDIIGSIYPVVFEQNTTGRTYANIAGFPNTLGRLLRLLDSRTISGNATFYDIGIDQNGSFFITDRSYSTTTASTLPNKVIVINSQDFVGINMGTGFGTTPTAFFHVDCANSNSGVRFESLPTGTGFFLYVDNNGYVRRSAANIGSRLAQNPNLVDELELEVKELQKELAQLKTQIQNINKEINSNTEKIQKE